MKARIFPALTILPLLISSLFFSPYAFAQASTDGINLQISPLPIELNAKPGTNAHSDLRVRNVGNKTEKLQVRLLAVSEDDNGEVHLTNPSPTDEWVKWVSFDRQTFDAPSNQWQTVKMSVNVPRSAAFGYYFAVEYLRAPHGNIFIAKGGKQVGVVDVNANRGNILPKGSRFFDAAWQDGFPVYQVKNGPDGQPLLDKKGQPQKSLRWDFSHANRLRFGHYTAHLVMVYDNGSRDVPMEATVSFWVIPWRVIGILLVVAIFVAVGLWSTFGKSKRLIQKIHGKKA
jgi:hypothetical protein